MKCFGVAAEFNPFHDGHAYLINKVKEMTGSRCCIAAMSGDFTQRGEPAVFDKWKRAAKAVEQGADLVLEIPHGIVELLAWLIDDMDLALERSEIQLFYILRQHTLNEHTKKIS